MKTLRNIKPAKFNHIFEYFPELSEVLKHDEVLLAGGALRTLIHPTDEICDIDIFFTGFSPVEEIKRLLLHIGFTRPYTCGSGFLQTFQKPRSDGRHTKVQLITRRAYTDADDLVNSFDLSPCCVAWDGKVLTCSDNWVRDVKNKVVSVNNIEYPCSTVYRIAKYKNKSYTYPSDLENELFFSISDTDWKENQRGISS